MAKTRLSAFALAAILAAYAVIVALFAVNVPRWNAPDEPAHFNYARELAEQGKLPILTAGSYDSAYLEQLKSARFPADMSIDSLRYEAHQPPLYYLLAAAAYRATAFLDVAGQILALRLLSALLGGALVVIGYRLTRDLFPADRWLPAGAAAFLAFNPMLLAVNSAIGNDPAANLILALILWESVRLVLHPAHGQPNADPSRSHLRLGLWIGLALLIKTTAYAAVVIAAVAIVAHVLLRKDATYSLGNRRSIRRSPFRPAAARLLGAGLAALLVSGWWFARNLSVYGLEDPFGLRRHDQLMLASGQPAAPAITLASLQAFVTVTFHSFWGQFGWMGILLDERLYLLLSALTIAAVLGLLDYAIRRPEASVAGDVGFRWALTLLALAMMLVAAAMVQYSFGSFLQPQGRYLFPAAVPFAIFLVLGLRQLAPRQHRALIVGSLAVGLVALDVASLYGYIIPGLTSHP